MSLPKYYKEKLYNDDQRKKVTKYLQKRMDDKMESEIKALKHTFPDREENFYLQKLEERKNLSKFEKRNNEIF